SRTKEEVMAHSYRILSAAATSIALFVASVAFAQQEQPQPRPQQRPGADGTVGSGMMQGMDCQRMMQGQAANPQTMNEQMKAMMEHCRRMMGQTPSSPSAPDKKE